MWLWKDLKDKILEIWFEAKQPEIEDGQDDYEYQQEQEQQSETMNDFQVFLSNKSNDHGIAYDCTAVDNNVQINSVAFTEEISKFKAKNRVHRMVEEYNGPEFYSLDERL